MSLPAAWRSRWWIWALPLAFCLVNGLVLLLHPGRTGGGFLQMEADLEQEMATLRQLESKRAGIEDVLASASENHRGLEELYGNRFATQSERLTDVLAEVKRLARRSGFDPPRMSYPEQALEEFDLVRKGIDFQVEGSYAQFRTLLNLLEVSEYFLVLEDVRLRGSEGSSLSINLRLATLFAEEKREGTAAGGGAS